MCRNGTDNIYAYYNYDSPDGFCDAGPTKWITILFIALFSLTTALHFGQAIWKRRWFFIPTMVTGGLGEILGWAGRLWGSENPNNFTAFVIQICTTIFCPSFMTAANFIVLGKTIAYLNGQAYSRLSAKKFTWVFLSFDVFCLFVQSAGGGIASSNNVTQAKVGSNIALAGIALQTAAIAVYSLVAGEFVYRITNDKPHSRSLKPSAGSPGNNIEDKPVSDTENAPVTRTNSQEMNTSHSYSGTLVNPYAGRIPENIKLVFLGLALSTLFLLIRAIYRLVEFADGWGHRIQSTETFFNVLDGGMVVLSMVVINVFHPGWLMPDKKIEEGV